jgi:hypothetical protein
MKSEIPVGVVYDFKLLMGDSGVGVYRKQYRGRTSFIIAPIPPVRAYSEPPTSVLREFATEAEAIQTFIRWKQDRLASQPISRKKKQAPDPAQSELALGSFKTKEQIESEARARRLGGDPS